MLSPRVKWIAGSSQGVARDRRRIDIQSYVDGPKRRAMNAHARKAMVAALTLAAPVGGAVALYVFVLPGLSSARPQPSRIEVAVAPWLLRHSVPASARQQRNPL